jgi:predicted CXXCH cytochrome family protein
MVLFIAAAVPMLPMGVQAKTGIINTKHNLSVSGPGDIRALTETRICIFCHTPHNAAPATPLWNKRIDAKSYTLYSSTTMGAKPSQPTGPTRLCLTCHDGTIALGEVLRPAEDIGMTMQGGIPSTRRSYLGTILADDHPVSFSYYDSLPNSELAPSPPSDLLLYGSGSVHCSTCHDAHDNTNKKFLAVNNVNSGLCTLCHSKNGWTTAAHRTSPDTWNGGAPDPWPRTGMNSDFNWTTVAQNGCENCHTPHNAGGAERILNYLEEEKNCYPCHNGNVAAKNVQAQFQKISRHRVEMTTLGVTPNHHTPGESPAFQTGHVECVDCHNPHASNDTPAASPPALSGSLKNVSGVNINGAGITPPNYAGYEYEICFKCHGDSETLFPVVPRVVNTVNARVEFSLDNPSYHPVAGAGRNPDVPSLPSASAPTLTATSMIYCTDCHDSDESVSVGGSGPRGPHGSLYSPLIRERCETTDNTPESPGNYALCYRCHNRSSILMDESFRKNGTSGKGGHSGHLGTAVNAPCSACHDSHGVKDDEVSGDHTHLMNFDTRTASGSSPASYPVFMDKGSRSGSCTLMCHGVSHTGDTPDSNGKTYNY